MIPGGREPDRGPAEAAGPGPVEPDKPGQPGGGQGTASEAKVELAAGVRRGALLRRGLRVKVSCPGACSVDAGARYAGRRIAPAPRAPDPSARRCA